MASLTEYHQQRMQEAVAVRVAGLRALADKIERETNDRFQRALKPSRDWDTYGRIAESIVHDVTWGVANMNLGTLISIATEADIEIARTR